VKDIGGQLTLKRVKAAMVALKGQIKQQSISENVIHNTLFTCSRMRDGKHHLYDELGLGADADRDFEDKFSRSLRKHTNSSSSRIL
jgi:hypothetical protein